MNNTYSNDQSYRNNNSGNLSYKDIISEYLNRRADEDEFFREKYLNSGKTIDDAMAYIINVAQEKRNKSSVVVMSDEEVFGLAVHFFLEDSITAKPMNPVVQRIPDRKLNPKPASKPATPDSDGYIQLELF